VTAVVSALPARCSHIDIYRVAQAEDTVCSALISYCTNGWPDKHSLPAILEISKRLISSQQPATVPQPYSCSQEAANGYLEEASLWPSRHSTLSTACKILSLVAKHLKDHSKLHQPMFRMLTITYTSKRATNYTSIATASLGKSCF